jgi:hypothetical protein
MNSNLLLPLCDPKPPIRQANSTTSPQIAFRRFVFESLITAHIGLVRDADLKEVGCPTLGREMCSVQKRVNGYAWYVDSSL